MTNHNFTTCTDLAAYLRVSGTTINRLAAKYGIEWVVLHKRQRVMANRDAARLIKQYEKETSNE